MTHFTRDPAPTQHAGGGGTRLGSHGRATGQARRTGHERRPVTTAGGGHAQGLALPRAAGFWLVAGVLFLLLFASAAASPLYRVYQAQWGFSAATLTAVFAVYVLVLLLTLLIFGSLSDYLGRRRVMSVALAAGAGACGLFLAAHGAGLLFAARALQGAAVGAATSAAGAALIDLQPARSARGPVVTSAAVLLGLGAGGLGTSALAQYAPAPTHLIWWLLLGACAAAALAVLAIPQTTPPRAGALAALRPRVAVPRQARHTLTAALPVMIAAPALNGFYLSLGPSLAAQVLRSPDLVWGGLVIFLVAGTGAAATVGFRTASPPAAMLAGCLILLTGAVITLAAIDTASAAAFLAGTAVAGAGVGTGFFAGAYRVLTPLASPGQRAGLVAAIWVIFYLAFSIPVVAAGVATTHFGLHHTAEAYTTTLAILAAAAAGSFLSRRHPPPPATGPAAAQRPPSPSTSMTNRQPGVSGGRRLHP
jgi:Major Facilitator Superfamily